MKRFGRMFGVGYVAVSVFCAAGSADAASVTWNGGSGTWGDGSQWSSSPNPPAAGDAVTVSSGSVLITSNTPLLSSFTITNATLTFTNWNTTLSTSGEIDIRNGSTLSLPAAYTNSQMSNNVVLVCGGLTLHAGATIRLDGRGYRGGDGTIPAQSQRGFGPGGGYGGPTWGGGSGGGGYGGEGGDNWTGT